MYHSCLSNCTKSLYIVAPLSTLSRRRWLHPLSPLWPKKDSGLCWEGQILESSLVGVYTFRFRCDFD